jgi:hypothetical protein
LLLVALGRKPTPGSEVRITLGHEDVWPPTYYLQWRDTSAAGPSVTTGYLLVQCMEQQRSAYVTVGDAIGQERVDVRPVSPETVDGACAQVAENPLTDRPA